MRHYVRRSLKHKKHTPSSYLYDTDKTLVGKVPFGVTYKGAKKSKVGTFKQNLKSKRIVWEY